jgi:hypothetical protein
MKRRRALTGRLRSSFAQAMGERLEQIDEVTRTAADDVQAKLFSLVVLTGKAIHCALDRLSSWFGMQRYTGNAA